MICKNKVLVIVWNEAVKYKGGMRQVLGSAGVVKPLNSPNGAQSEQECGGIVKCNIKKEDIYDESNYDITAEFQCDTCGKIYNNVMSISQIEKLVEANI